MANLSGPVTTFSVGAADGATDGATADAPAASLGAASLGALLDFVPVQAARNAANPAIAVPWTKRRRDTSRGGDDCSLMCLLNGYLGSPGQAAVG